MKQFKINMLIVLVVTLSFPINYAMAQQASSIDGVVVDEMGEPVKGATITVVDNEINKVSTDSEGNFEISTKSTNTVRIKAQGYTPKEIQVNTQNQLNITLNSESKTSAIDNIDATEFGSQKPINPGNALYGQIPGLMVLENGGPSPTSPTMFIRGVNTLNDNSPLILVDGFEQRLSSISINEIKDVSVLKDAAALARYGQRGANGVISITTKRGGTDSDLQVTASSKVNMTQPTQLPGFVDSYQYAQARNETRINDGLSPTYSSADLEAYQNNESALYPNTDWFERVLRDNGMKSNYNISFQGGGEEIRYFTMLNYDMENGIFGPVNRNSGYSTQQKYSRFRLRTNLDIDLTENLLFKVGITGNSTEHNSPGAGTTQIFNDLYSVPSAVFPPQNPDGSFGGSPNYASNPLARLISTGYNKPNSREMSLSGTLEQNLDVWLEGLDVELKANYTNFGYYSEGQSQSYSYASFTPERNGTGQIVDTTVTRYNENSDLDFYSNVSNKRLFIDVQGNINYASSFGDNNVFSSTLSISQSNHSFEGRDNEYHRRNLFGNVHFGFKDKYFFGISASYGGNNLLQEGERYSLFPAISAGWIASNEEFIQDINFVDHLNFRASWGIVGSDLLPTDNPYEHYYIGPAQGYAFQNSNNYVSGFAEGHLASNNFTHERSQKINFGVDAKFISHLSLDVDLFYDKRTNVLITTEERVSDLLGIDPTRESDGIVENKGIEAALTWQDTFGELSYHLGGQFSFAKNEIVDMQEQYRPHDYLKRTGHPVGQNFGLETIGIFQNQQEIDDSPQQDFGQVEPGDLKYKDQNGDGVINELDEVPIGNASNYPEMYFSADLGVSYKGVSVSALFQGTGNYSVYLNTQSVFRPMRNNNTVSNYYYNRRWTQETSESATLPRLSNNSIDNNFRSSTTWLNDRSYIKLRTLEIAYTLPQSIVRSLKLNSMNINLVGNNLFSIDNVPVFDPEHISTDYPILRSYSLGLEIKF